MNSEELAEIKARVEAATPGLWEFRYHFNARYPGVVATVFAGDDAVANVYPRPNKDGYPADNATFIANARQDIPALLAEVERLQNESLDQIRGFGGDLYIRDQEIAELRAEVERLQTAHGIYSATVAQVTALQAENERLRKIIPEICPHCGGRMDVDPGHIERCYCLPVIRTLQAENEKLRILSVNLAYQCRIVLDQWPEFELDMSLPAGHQLWRRATEKYLAQLSEKAA